MPYFDSCILLDRLQFRYQCKEKTDNIVKLQSGDISLVLLYDFRYFRQLLVFLCVAELISDLLRRHWLFLSIHLIILYLSVHLLNVILYSYIIVIIIAEG